MGNSVGRPPLGCTRELKVMLRPEVDDKIRTLAEAHGVPRRQLVRRLVEDALIDVGELDPAVANGWRHRRG